MFGKTKQSGSASNRRSETTNRSRSNVEASKASKATKRTSHRGASSRAEAGRACASTTRNCGSRSSSASRSNKKTTDCK